MATAELQRTFHEIVEEIPSVSLAASEVYTYYVELPPGYISGIIHLANRSTSSSQPESGGVYFFSPNSEDAVGRVARHFVGRVLVSGGSPYSFTNWRPEVYNKNDHTVLSSAESFGTVSYTSGITLNDLYVDTAENRLILEFENTQTGPRTLNVFAHGRAFANKEAP